MTVACHFVVLIVERGSDAPSTLLRRFLQMELHCGSKARVWTTRPNERDAARSSWAFWLVDIVYVGQSSLNVRFQDKQVEKSVFAGRLQPAEAPVLFGQETLAFQVLCCPVELAGVTS